MTTFQTMSNHQRLLSSCLAAALVALAVVPSAAAGELSPGEHDSIALSITLASGPVAAGLDAPHRARGGLNGLPQEFHDDFVFGISMAVTSWVAAGIGTALLIHALVEGSDMDPDQPTMGGAMLGAYSLIPFGISLGLAEPSWIACGVLETNRAGAETATLR